MSVSRFKGKSPDYDRVRDWRPGDRVIDRRGRGYGWIGYIGRIDPNTMVVEVVSRSGEFVARMDSRALVRYDLQDPVAVRLWLTALPWQPPSIRGRA